MKRIASILSILALAGTVMPSVFYLAGQTTLPTLKTIMLLSAIIWFIVTPFWMEHKLGE